MIVLGIDPAKRSGWAVALDHETILAHGHAICADDRTAAVHRAVGLAGYYDAPLRIVMESAATWGGSTSTAIGMGKARGQWFQAIEHVTGVKPDKVRTVDVQTWRAATHGIRRVEGTRDERTAQFKRAACAYTGIRDEDAAEAACIAMWGAMEVS